MTPETFRGARLGRRNVKSFKLLNRFPMISTRTMTNTKPSMTAADLFVLLDREFRRRRSRDCKGCVIQLPYRVDRGLANGATWDIDMPQSCGTACKEAFEELVSEFQGIYELKNEVADSSR